MEYTVVSMSVNRREYFDCWGGWSKRSMDARRFATYKVAETNCLRLSKFYANKMRHSFKVLEEHNV